MVVPRTWSPRLRQERCDPPRSRSGPVSARARRTRRNRPLDTGVPAEDIRAAARLMPLAATRHLLGLVSPSIARVRPWSWRLANLAMRQAISAGPESASTARGQNKRPGRMRHGFASPRTVRHRPYGTTALRAQFENAWGVETRGTGDSHSEHAECRCAGSSRRCSFPGRGSRAVGSNTQHVEEGSRHGSAVIGRTFSDETAKSPSLPSRTSSSKRSNVHERRARGDQPRASRHGVESRMEESQVARRCQRAGITRWSTRLQRDHGRGRDPLTPNFRQRLLRPAGPGGRSSGRARRRSRQDADHARETFVRWQGHVRLDDYQQPKKGQSQVPAVADDGRILTQYNVGAQTRRTDTVDC